MLRTLKADGYYEADWECDVVIGGELLLEVVNYLALGTDYSPGMPRV